MRIFMLDRDYKLPTAAGALFSIALLLAGNSFVCQAQDTIELIDILHQNQTIETVCIDDSVAYFCRINTLLSYDISNPHSPVPLDTLVLWKYSHGFERIRGIAVSDGKLFVPYATHGVFIVDVSNPSSLQVLNNFPVKPKLYFNDILKHDDFLYLLTPDSIMVYSIEDIMNPYPVASYFIYYNSYSLGVQLPWFVENNTVIFPATGFAAYRDSLRMGTFNEDGTISFHDPPAALSDVGDVTSLTKRGDMLYIGDSGNLYTFKYDFSSTPRLLSACETVEIPSVMVISGDYLMIKGHVEFAVYDISNPAEPKHLDTYRYHEPLHFFTDFEVVGDYIYLTAYCLAIFKLNTTGSFVSPDLPQQSESDVTVGTFYPNPCVPNGTASLTFSLPYQSPVSLSLYNSVGEKVHTRSHYLESGYHSEQIDLSNYQTGVYHCVIITGDQCFTRKVLVR